MRPFIQELTWRFTGHNSNAGHPRWHTALLRQRHPETVLFVLSNTECVLARMAKRRTIELPRDTPEYIDQDQSYGSANRSIGTVAIAEHVVRRIHANSRAYGAIHYNKGRTTASTGCGTVHVERLLAHSAQHGHNHGHISWQTPGHDGINRNFLRRDGALPYALYPYYVRGGQPRRLQACDHTFLRRWHDGQAIRPPLLLVQLIHVERVSQVIRG